MATSINLQHFHFLNQNNSRTNTRIQIFFAEMCYFRKDFSSDTQLDGFRTTNERFIEGYPTSDTS